MGAVVVEKLNQLETDVNELKVVQAVASREVIHVKDEIKNHTRYCKEKFEKDDKRHERHQDMLTKLNENVDNMSTSLNKLIPEIGTKIDKIQEGISKETAKSEIRDWFMKGIIALVIIGSFGSFFNGILTYNATAQQEQLQAANDKVDIHPIKAVPVPPRRQSMNSTEAEADVRR